MSTEIQMRRFIHLMYSASYTSMRLLRGVRVSSTSIPKSETRNASICSSYLGAQHRTSCRGDQASVTRCQTYWTQAEGARVGGKVGRAGDGPRTFTDAASSGVSGRSPHLTIPCNNMPQGRAKVCGLQEFLLHRAGLIISPPFNFQPPTIVHFTL